MVERPEVAGNVESRMSPAHFAIGRYLVSSRHRAGLLPFVPPEPTTWRDADTGRISAHATLSRHRNTSAFRK